MSKKQILIIIIVSIMIIVFFPFMLEIIVFRNDVYSALSNGEWSGFLGSYVGGVLGGIGTLLAVYITTKETRKSQRETVKQIEDEQKRNEKKERKQFADEIAKDVATYITNISKYFYANRALNRLDKDRDRLNKEFHSIQQEMQTQYDKQKELNIEDDLDEYSKIDLDINKLKQKKDEVLIRLQNIDKDIENNQADRTVAIERYFLLKIKLKDVDIGTDILNQLELIHKNSANVEGTDFDFISTETDKLLNMTVRFADRYINQKLI